MAYQNLEPFSKQLTIVIGLTVVGCMAFGLALSFYRNILFEQTLENMRVQNDELRSKIAAGYRDLEYYRSAQYKDKYAKENLNMVRPGEQALILAREEETRDLEPVENAEPTEQQEAAYYELLRQMPVIEHWKLYLFHREKIQELRTGL